MLPLVELVYVASVTTFLGLIIFLALILAINLLLYYFSRRFTQRKSKSLKQLPKVSILIPTKDEPKDLLRRLLYSLSKVDWPKDKLDIIIIDDSDVIKAKELKEVCNEFNSLLNITFIHRREPKGRKAGALNYGLKFSKGKYVMILDVDCEVSENILKESIPLLENGYDYVQISTDVNSGNTLAGLITNVMNWYREEIQVKGLNYFNIPLIVGYGYIIRKDVLEKVGGWHEKVLTEDIELMYRLLEGNYKGTYVGCAKVRYDAPPTLSDLRKQQERWLFGILQTLRLHFVNIIKLRRNITLKIIMLFFLLFYLGLLVNAYVMFLPLILEIINRYILFHTWLIACLLPFNITGLLFAYVMFNITKVNNLWNKIKHLLFSMLFFNAFSINALLTFLRYILRRHISWTVTPKVSVTRKSKTISRTQHKSYKIIDVTSTLISLISGILAIKRIPILIGWNFSLTFSFITCIVAELLVREVGK